MKYKISKQELKDFEFNKKLLEECEWELLLKLMKKYSIPKRSFIKTVKYGIIGTVDFYKILLQLDVFRKLNSKKMAIVLKKYRESSRLGININTIHFILLKEGRLK